MPVGLPDRAIVFLLIALIAGFVLGWIARTEAETSTAVPARWKSFSLPLR